jgi:hypothetical protein
MIYSGYEVNGTIIRRQRSKGGGSSSNGGGPVFQHDHN